MNCIICQNNIATTTDCRCSACIGKSVHFSYPHIYNNVKMPFMRDEDDISEESEHRFYKEFFKKGKF
jgi:hypothetical protein